MGDKIHPQCRCLSKREIAKVFSDGWIEDEEIEVDLGELVYMFDR